ncbi:MAG: hypothetical protein ABIL62_10595 [Planctomycetota bacterium]
MGKKAKTGTVILSEAKNLLFVAQIPSASSGQALRRSRRIWSTKTRRAVLVAAGEILHFAALRSE